jgi:protein disulfide-isomerase-like protein
MKLTSILLASIPLVASAKVVNLDDSNYGSITSETDLVFIKFFAPWCGHCKAMAKDWETLGTKMAADKPGILIAEVDCTSEEADDLCESNGVEGFPTLKYGDPEFLENYDGPRELDALYEFATTQIVPGCSPKNIDLCDADQKAMLEKLFAMSIEELEKAISDFDTMKADMEGAFDASTDSLEQEYMEMMEVNKEAKKEAKAASNYEILKSVMLMKMGEGNDEL